jgi:predicted transglutaminase-like cysteine proteinase
MLPLRAIAHTTAISITVRFVSAAAGCRRAVRAARRRNIGASERLVPILRYLHPNMRYKAACSGRRRTDAWSDLKHINLWVNHNINPETDTDHYGMIQWWRAPYGTEGRHQRKLSS